MDIFFFLLLLLLLSLLLLLKMTDKDLEFNFFINHFLFTSELSQMKMKAA